MGESVLLPGLSAQHRHLVSREPMGFDQFWAAYPRKVGKGAARAAYLKAMRKTDLGTMLDALAKARWPADPKFIPHPATWLHAERWDDEADNYDPVAKALGL